MSHGAVNRKSFQQLLHALVPKGVPLQFHQREKDLVRRAGVALRASVVNVIATPCYRGIALPKPRNFARRRPNILARIEALLELAQQCAPPVVRVRLGELGVGGALLENRRDCRSVRRIENLAGENRSSKLGQAGGGGHRKSNSLKILRMAPAAVTFGRGAPDSSPPRPYGCPPHNFGIVIEPLRLI